MLIDLFIAKFSVVIYIYVHIYTYITWDSTCRLENDTCFYCCLYRYPLADSELTVAILDLIQQVIRYVEYRCQHIYIKTYAHIYMCVIHIHILELRNEYMYMYLYLYIHVYDIYVHIYIYVCIYICM
jgi:hypothetical protein